MCGRTLFPDCSHEAGSLVHIGGLAGTFEISPGIRAEKFYHHWFTSDKSMFNLFDELGLRGANVYPTLIRKYGTQGIEVFGSVTLDTPVGGVNPIFR